MTFKLIGSGLAAAALLATCFSVQAAELVMPQRKAYKAPPLPPPARFAPAYTNWTGFYFGLNADYGWGQSRWDGPPPLEFNTNGGLFGLTVGYNFQTTGWLFGVEADYDWTKLRGNTVCGVVACETRNSWLSTVRARVGIPNDRFLPYVTGGVALGDIAAGNTTLGFGTASTKKTGWTAGAGLEFMLTGNLSAKLEYLYVDLGSVDCGTACIVAGTTNVNFSANIFRAGINFKFDPGGVAAKY
jgi:outer membrane immunogenic protein